MIRLKDGRSPIVKTYPFAEKQTRDDEYQVVDRYMCSPETDQDYANMEEASKLNYRLKYCTFTKYFQKNEERMCKKEVKPLFLERSDKYGKPLQCGFANNHIMHSLSYYVCIFHHSNNITI